MRLPCAIEGCETKSHARDWCEKHYYRWYRTGDPLGFRPGHRGPRKRKSHCKSGHALSGDNLRIGVRARDGGTTHVCKICSRESVYRVRAKVVEQ